MSTDLQAVQIQEQRVELVKFNGDPPAAGEYKEPAEIIEGIAGCEMKTTYRAGEGATIKWFSGDGTGHAVLTKEEQR